MRGKIPILTKSGRKNNIKVRYLVVSLAIGICNAVAGWLPLSQTASAAGCPDVKLVFARGSGGERWADKNYLAFRDTIEEIGRAHV